MNVVGLTPEQFKLFEFEAKRNCIPSGGYCKTNCMFCALKAQVAVGYCNVINWISIDDLHKVLPLIDPNRIIRFGEGRNFFSCEAFYHPNYIELLNILDDHFPTATKLTTSVCRGLSYSDLEKIGKTSLSIVAGVNTFDPDSRKKLMRSKDDLSGVIRTLDVCRSNIIRTSFVYTGDLDVLKRDIDTLHEINSEYVEKVPMMLRLIEWTKFADPEVKEIHDYSIKTWEQAVTYAEENVKYVDLWVRDLNSPVESESLNRSKARFLKDSIDFMNRYVDQLSTGRVAILLAESVYYHIIKNYPKLKDISLLVKNNTFGGSHIVTPLLGKDDVLDTIKQHPEFDKYLLHRSFSTPDGKDIAGRSYTDEFKANNVEFFD